MVRTLLRSALREIRQSLGRYLAILAIVGLGVGFFAGLRTCQPAMMATGLDYLSEHSLHDFRLLSTLGFTQEDVDNFAALDGVAAARGAVYADFLTEVEPGREVVLRAHSLTAGLHQPALAAGRMPQADNECLADARYFSEKMLGAVLAVSESNEEETRDLLHRGAYTVVGLCWSPYYLNYDRGTSTLGGGSVAGFVYIPEGGFDFEAYYEIFLTVDDPALAYSIEYGDQIDAIKPAVEELTDRRAQERYDEIRGDALEEIADAEREIADGWDEYRTERTDAEAELDDAYRELTDGEAEYAKGQRDYEQGRRDYAEGLREFADGQQKVDDAQQEVADAQQKLDDGQRELADARRELDEGWDEYYSGKAEAEAELADALAQLTDGEREYQDGLEAYNDGMRKLEDAEEEIAGGEAELREGQRELAVGEAELADAWDKLESGRRELEQNEALLDASEEQLTAGEAGLEAGQAELDAQRQSIEDAIAAGLMSEEEGAAAMARLEAAQAELDGQRAQLEAARAQITAGRAQLAEGWDDYNEGKAAYQAGAAEIAEARRQLRDGQAELERGRRELAGGQKELADAKVQLEDARQELDEGWDEYEKGRAEAEAELTDALKELTDGEAAYSDGLQELSEGRAELAEGQQKLEDAQRELADAQRKLDDAKADLDRAPGELADARRELDEGWTEYNDGKSKADREFADAEAELTDAEREVADAYAELADLKQATTYVLTRQENTGYVNFDNDTSIVAAISVVFPAFFFLVAALVCMTTMTRMVDEQRTQIGVLKAMGYSNWQIMGKYLFYAGSAALLGSVLGYALGAVGLPWIVWEIYGMIYGFAPLKQVFLPELALLSFSAALLCAMGSTYLACRVELGRQAAELIRPKSPRAGKRVFLEYIGPVWRRLSFLHKVSVRNVLRYRSRLVMMVLGIGGCTALLCTGFGIRDSIAHVADDQFDEITLYDYAVTFQEGQTPSSAEAYLEACGWLPEEGLLVHSGSVDVQAPGGGKSVHLVVSSTDSLDGFLSLHSGETAIPYPGGGEVVVNTGLAEKLGLSVGDTVRLQEKSLGEMEATVSAIADNYVFNYAYVSAGTFQRQLGRTPEYNTLYVRAHPGADPYEEGALLLEDEGVGSVTVNEATRSQVDSMLSRMDYIVAVVVLCAAALAFIVLYNLTNINITERVREIATIKVLGFYQGEVAAYVFREIIILSALGSLAGLGMGKALHAFVMEQIQIDAMFFACRITPLSYLVAFVVTMLFTAVISLGMRPRLRKIDMAESLKSIE